MEHAYVGGWQVDRDVHAGDHKRVDVELMKAQGNTSVVGCQLHA